MPVESTTRQRPIAVGDAQNLYHLGIAALVYNPLGDNASAVRRRTSSNALFLSGAGDAFFWHSKRKRLRKRLNEHAGNLIE